MNKAWVDIIVKVVVEIIDFVAGQLKDDNAKEDGKNGSSRGPKKE
jgi:hypothetical protein